MSNPTTTGTHHTFFRIDAAGGLLVTVWVDLDHGTVEMGLHGELCTATAPVLERYLTRWIEQVRRWRVLVDLSGVDFVDGRGLGLLVNLHRGGCQLASPSRQVRRLLEVCDLQSLLFAPRHRRQAAMHGIPC